MIYIIQIISCTPYSGYKLNSLLTCLQQGFISQLVEHCTGIMEVMGWNPIETSELFLGFFSNCLSCFITVTIIFACILYLQFMYVIYIMYKLFLEGNCWYGVQKNARSATWVFSLSKEWEVGHSELHSAAVHVISYCCYFVVISFFSYLVFSFHFSLKLSLLMLLLNYILQFSDFWLFYFCLSLRFIYLLLFCSLSLYIGKTVADFSFSILLQTFFLIQVQICTKLAWITSWSTYTDQLLENYPLRDYSIAIIIQNPPTKQQQQQQQP